MSESKNVPTDSLVTFNINVEGSSISETINVVSIEIEKSINQIARAKLVVSDGRISNHDFPISSSDTFVPGKRIQIAAGYEENNEVVFKGVISKQILRADSILGSELHVMCDDEAIKMTVGRKNKRFSKTTDSSVIKHLIAQYSNLNADVSCCSKSLLDLQQYDCSDWDFMLQRASRNSLVANTVNGKVSVFSPLTKRDSALTLTYGENILKFDCELNAVTQIAEVQASAWDYTTQKVISSNTLNKLAGPGNLSSKTLSEAIGLSTHQLQTTSPLDVSALGAWAESQKLTSALAKITGEVSFQGCNFAEAGSTITLKGVGNRFEGEHLVSRISHKISEGDWISEVGIGLKNSAFEQESCLTRSEEKIIRSSASDEATCSSGLYNAKVKKTAGDPMNEFRIQVDLPLFDPTGEGVWARLTNFYSSNGCGAFFYPEVGDEVIVGFLNDDPRFPVILGSLYSSAIQPSTDLKLEDDNTIKAIVSKSGLTLAFNDKNKSIALTTPDKNQIILDQENGRVQINDQNENKIVLSQQGISLSSRKSIGIEAGEQVVIKGKAGVIIESNDGDIDSKGININQTAKIEYSAQAKAKTSVSSAGELIVKGALVQIN